MTPVMLGRNKGKNLISFTQGALGASRMLAFRASGMEQRTRRVQSGVAVAV